MSSIDLATGFKIGVYLLNREKRTLFRDQYIIQVQNEFSYDTLHYKATRDILICPTHVNSKKERFSKRIFLKCDQTSVDSL